MSKISRRWLMLWSDERLLQYATWGAYSGEPMNKYAHEYMRRYDTLGVYA